MNKNILVVIPARGGSKGLPGKNIKVFKDKPLIVHTIDFAKEFFTNDSICVSTDNYEIKEVAEKYIPVDFIRPAEFATDTSSSYDVLIHAINFYQKKDISFEYILLLQPTTPYRKAQHLKEILEIKFESDLDMIVSVNETSSNPYYNLFEENENGLISKSKESDFVRRQDCPKIYEINGAYYLISVKSLLSKPISKFEKIKKYLINDKKYYLDIDNQADWDLALKY